MAKKPIPVPPELMKRLQTLVNIMLKEENDMVCAVISAAFLDQCLASLLQAFLVDGKTSKELLQKQLGEYFTRARLAYCLGLIPKSLLTELSTIGNIRNEFAHSDLEARFSDHETKLLCDNLMSHVPSELANQVNKEAITPRLKFISSVAVAIGYIIYIAHNKTKHLQRKEGEWSLFKNLFNLTVLEGSQADEGKT